MSYPNSVKTAAYKKAFAHYLRTGAPIDLTLKAAAKAEAEAEHTTTHYIWRTRGDNKVRASHAANNGKIFSWNDPPPTGHPGEDFRCRCWAQPYRPAAPEHLDQPVTSIVDEGLSRWEWYDFVIHYYFGGGAAVRLANVGHLQDVINRANGHDLEPHQVFEGVEIQVLKAARADAQNINLFTEYMGYDMVPAKIMAGFQGGYLVDFQSLPAGRAGSWHNNPPQRGECSVSVYDRSTSPALAICGYGKRSID